MTEFLRLLKVLIALVPFVILALLNAKANLKKEYRSAQFAMPVAALIYCTAALLLLDKIYNLGRKLIETVFGFIGRYVPFVSSMLAKLNLPFWAFFAANLLMFVVYLLLKRILVTVLKGVFKTGNSLYETVVHPFYEYDADDDRWFVRNELGQLRGLFKMLYYAALLLSCALMMVSTRTYLLEPKATSIFYPFFGVILVGELYFFLDGLLKREFHSEVSAEEDSSAKKVNYSLLRGVLRRLFPDKLNGENSQANEALFEESIDQLLDRICESEDPAEENYGKFMRDFYNRERRLDRNYLYSGRDLLRGKSVLFNNPFYWDFIPYTFYAVNRVLLQRRRVLVILGRSGAEGDAAKWVEEGLTAVNNTPGLWKTAVLQQGLEAMPDVGILTRSDVHDMDLHEACAPFFADTAFVILLEPSRLLPTAQIGLNCIAKRLRKNGVCFCAIDKNCDGLVDALSHALMTELCEVSATERHDGVSSYMLWDADSEPLQHRLLPNIARFLGFGTELSFAALKNQVDTTCWYGGDAFPVADMHWIATQYYHDLLSYAELPATQQTMDDRFVTSHNLWEAKSEPFAFLTVEDEAHNMFEVRRAFSTRAREQGFVNILSDEYLLKDYMAENAEIFETDAKAIPLIVCDYVRSARNVALRTILLMSSGTVTEKSLCDELSLIGIDDGDPVLSLWNLLCRSMNPVSERDAVKLVLPGKRGLKKTYDLSVICSKRKYDVDTGRTAVHYYIEDEEFVNALVSSIRNADCILEDEQRGIHFLGTELCGHIFQKYLPGQFFTKDGKYYEMLSVTAKGQMLVRRASDHIDGRPSYRQIRRYHIHDMTESGEMGAVREIGGMKVSRMFADLSVDTPAYWLMNRHGDFDTAKRIAINAVPRRTYNNKQLLRVQLPEEGLTPEIRYTVTVLFNEIFRSLFAENQPYIVAVTPGSEALGQDAPLTYSVDGDACPPEENVIYIIEDSQLDMGLLVSVERCLKRIFEIACDYLDWHEGALEASLNPPPEPEVPEFRVQPLPENGEIPKKKKGLKGFFGRIGEFFKKLFGRKKKDPNAPDKPKKEKKKKKKKKGEPVPEPEIDAVIPAPETPEGGEAAPASEAAEFPSAPEALDAPEPGAEFMPEPGAGAGSAPMDPAEPEILPGQEPEDPAAAPFAVPEDDTVRMSFSTGSRLNSAQAESSNDPDADVPEDLPPAEDPAAAEGEAPIPEGITVEYESIDAVSGGPVPVRKPYHERYFLLFGGTVVPAAIAVGQTLEYLQQLGYGRNPLKQARDNRDMAERIEKGLQGASGNHLCDFCGRPLSGIDHEILADGRERCSFCSRSAIRSPEEFQRLLASALKNLSSFFGVQITAPVRIQMVNAKKLHRRLGKSFVPTGNHDGRTLGVAIRDRSGYSILVENGAPRTTSMMTLVHELTHIWQYLNWNADAIAYMYGKDLELEVYEGMSKWVEIQYAYLVGEIAAGKREELITRLRDDEYGHGFLKYVQRYPLNQDFQSMKHMPFEDTQKPL